MGFGKNCLMIVMMLVFSLSVLAADISLTTPLGGEYFNQDVIDVTWNWNNASCGAGTDAVIVEFSDDSGNAGSWSILTASASASDETFPWNTSGYVDLNTYQVRLSSTCNVPDEITSDVTLDKTKPIPTFDNETINEGEGVTLDASDSDDTDDLSPLVKFEWDIDNDGTYDYEENTLDNTRATDTLTLTWSELVSFGIDNEGESKKSDTTSQ